MSESVSEGSLDFCIVLANQPTSQSISTFLWNIYHFYYDNQYMWLPVGESD